MIRQKSEVHINIHLHFVQRHVYIFVIICTFRSHIYFFVNFKKGSLIILIIRTVSSVFNNETDSFLK